MKKITLKGFKLVLPEEPEILEKFATDFAKMFGDTEIEFELAPPITEEQIRAFIDGTKDASK